jgi:predicted rRNA methylase YqxC with S4 and FtsJ domains
MTQKLKVTNNKFIRIKRILPQIQHFTINQKLITLIKVLFDKSKIIN